LQEVDIDFSPLGISFPVDTKKTSPKRKLKREQAGNMISTLLHPLDSLASLEALEISRAHRVPWFGADRPPGR